MLGIAWPFVRDRFGSRILALAEAAAAHGVGACIGWFSDDGTRDLRALLVERFNGKALEWFTDKTTLTTYRVFSTNKGEVRQPIHVESEWTFEFHPPATK